MNQKTSTDRFKLLVWVTSAVFVAWWLYITLILKSPDHNSVNNQIFGASYGVLSLLGGLIGLVASKKWGGYKSLVGRALIFFSLGLLAQEFGQLTYSYYTYVSKIDIPYPSVGDIGYFGSVLFYIYGAILLSQATGAKITLKKLGNKALALLIPIVLLVTSYMFFLRGYSFDRHHPLTVFLDFGYPFGQALYIAIAILAFIISRKLLGGVMRNKILFIIFALVIQYVADFTFLNSAKTGSAFPGGANDLMYLLAYVVMALALNSYRNLSLQSNSPPPADTPKEAN